MDTTSEVDGILPDLLKFASALDSTCDKAPFDQLRCFACRGVFYRPMTLQCGHSCCQECLPSVFRCTHCNSEIAEPRPSCVNVSLSSIAKTSYPKESSAREIASKGDALMQRDMVHDAILKYTESISLTPESGYLTHKRGMAYNALKDAERAFKDIIHSVKRSRLPETHLLLSEMYMYMGVNDDELAAISLINCLVLNPSNETVMETAQNVIARILAIEERKLASLRQAGVVLKDVTENVKKRLKGRITADIKGRPTTDYNAVDKTLLDETDFCCAACCDVYYDPVCTPCGHSFCRGCLERCIDHNHRCAMCKTLIREAFQYQKCILPTDASMDAIMKASIPEEYEENACRLRAEIDALKESIPLFVCTFAYPSLPCPLHVFEPRYRLMMRRAADFHNSKFGITAPSEEKGFHQIGTILHMNDISFFNDGRSLVNTTGKQRFEVLSHSTCDGYFTAKVRYLADIPVEDKDVNTVKQLLDTVYVKAARWQEKFNANFKHQLSLCIGEFPEKDDTLVSENGPSWMWWVMAALPLDNEIKWKFLGNCRLLNRLQALDRWLK